MNEAGLDIISSQKPKIIRERENMIGSSEKSVNIGCIDKTECPMLFINNVIDWALKTQSAYLLRRSERLEIDKGVREIAQSIKLYSKSKTTGVSAATSAFLFTISAKVF